MATNGNGSNGSSGLSAPQQLMADGCVMQYYTQPDGADSAPKSRSIYIWWEPAPTPGKLGTIYFNDDIEKKEKNKVDGQSLPLNKIADVFSGKQAAIFKQASLSSLPSEQCFSFGSKVLPLNLQAESGAVRSAWISGIKEVFSKGQAAKKSATTDPVKKDVTTPTAAASTTNGATTNGAASSSTTSATTNSSDPIAAMVAGQTFIVLNGLNPTIKSDVFVFYDKESSKFGVLYQTPAEKGENGEYLRKKDESSGIPMHRVSDVYLGKRAAEFTTSSAPQAPSNQCFSIVSKERSLHLIAPSEPIRATWLAGVKDIFAQQKAAAAEKKKAGSNATLTTPTSKDTAGSVSPSNANGTGVQSPPNVLADGRMYTRLTIVDGALVSSPLYLWHDANDGKLGTLYYNSVPNDKTKSSERSMPVAKIKDVFLGRQTPEFKHESAKDIPSNTCFSLVINKEKSEGLHLVAQDDQMRNATLATIKGFWATPKKKVDGVVATTPTSGSSKEERPLPPIPDAAKERQEKERADKVKADAATLEAVQQQQQVKAEPVTDVPKSADLVPVAEEKNEKVVPVVEAVQPAQPAPAQDVAAGAVNSSANGNGNGNGKDHAVPAPSSSSSRSEATAKLTAAIASTPEKNITAMREGDFFKSYTIVPNSQEQPAPEEIFVFLSEDSTADGPIGSLYYNPALNSAGVKEPNREKSSERQLPLHVTKDVFVGIHSWKKASAPKPPMPTSRALSLVAGEKALHLEARDDETRIRWATGIRNVFEAAHTKAQAKKAASATPIPEPKVESPTAGTAAADDKSLTPLIKGSEFLAHSVSKGELVSKPVFLFYNPTSEKLGTLYWCDVGKRESILGQSIPLHRISDVFLGKHASYKDLPGAEKRRTAQCFTLASRAVTVHLEAKSSEHRAATIEEIKGVFTKSGKKVDENKPVTQPKPSVDASSSNGHVLVLPEVPMSPRTTQTSSSSSAPVVAFPISEGQDFEAWTLDDKGLRSRPHPVHVWFEQNASSLGSLYWSDGYGKKVKSADKVLPLNEITDVFIGKHVEEFKHVDATEVPHDRCISLRSQTHPNHNLNLVASSSQVQRRWIRGLRQAFSENPETIIETRPVKQGETPREAISSPKASRVVKQKLAAFAEEGHRVTVITEDGKRQTQSVMWFEPQDGRAGTIYWTSGTKRSVAAATEAKQGIPVHTICDVYAGKKTAVMRSDACSSIPSNAAFSLASKTRSLDAVAQNDTERKRILDHISAAVHGAGTKVRELQAGAGEGNAVVNNAALRRDLAFIEQGQIVLLHHTLGAEPRVIFLWYEPSYGKQGCFFWNDVVQGQPATKQKVPKQNLMLQHITDVAAGRQSDILKASKSKTLKSENSFSLLTSKSPQSGATRLDVQVGAKKERDQWLSSLRMIFSATSKKIVEGSGALGAQSKRLKEGTIVDTWYGRGVVLAPTRRDGITTVRIGDTTCHFNAETIKPVQVLYTPYGAGVAPLHQSAQQKNRRDGIRVVELPWAVAYMNAESISLDNPAERAYGASKTNGLQSKQESLAFLQQGLPFTRVQQGGKTQPIFITYNPSATSAPGGLGSLEYYNGSSKPQDANEKPVGSIPMKTLSDLMLGRQSSPLRSLSSSVAPDARSLTLVQKDSSTYDLITADEVTRKDFVYALFNLLSTTGRKITEQRVGSSPVPVETPAGQASAQRRYSFVKSSAVPTTEQATQDLTRGAQFTLILLQANSTKRIKDEVFVTMDAKDRTLTWSPTTWSPDRNDAIRTIQLSLIRDVYYNKKTPLFLEKEYQSVQSERVFSIGVKGGIQWNLIAQSKEVRDTFFFGLQAILKPSSAAPSSSSASSPSVSSPSSPKNTGSDIVSNGQMMTRWYFSPTNSEQVLSERVFIFHAQDGTKYGSLYWNAKEGDRTQSIERKLPLHVVKDVYMGKNTPVMKSRYLDTVGKEVLFSLVATSSSSSSSSSTSAPQPVSLNLQAKDNASRTAWISVLRGFWKNTTVTSTPKGSPQPASPMSAGPSSGFGQNAEVLPVKTTGPALKSDFVASLNTTSTHSLYIPPSAAIQYIQNGTTFQNSLDAFYVAQQGFDSPFGSIYTTQKAGSREMLEENQYAIHRIEVVNVTQNEIILQTSTQKLVLQSDKKEVIASWLCGLQYLFGVSGFRLTSAGAGDYKINDPKGMNLSPVNLAIQSSITSIQKELEDGFLCNNLIPSFEGTQHTTQRLPIKFFLDSGVFYWCAPSKRDMIKDDDACSIKVGDITRCVVGSKNTPCTLTIQAKETTLNLEAKNVGVLNVFLANLTAYLTSMNIYVQYEKDNSNEVKRSYLLFKPKATPRTGPTKATSSSSVSDNIQVLSPASAADENLDATVKRFLTNGLVFTAYTQLAKGQLVHKTLIMWIGDQASSTPILYWGDAEDPAALAHEIDPEGDNELELDDITNVQAGGKYTPVLQSLSDADVSPSKCVCITSNHVVFDLVAESTNQAKAITQAIRSFKPKGLLVGNGSK